MFCPQGPSSAIFVTDNHKLSYLSLTQKGADIFTASLFQTLVHTAHCVSDLRTRVTDAG